MLPGLLWPVNLLLIEDGPKEPAGHGDFRRLKDYVPGIRDHLRSDLNEPLP